MKRLIFLKLAIVNPENIKMKQAEIDKLEAKEYANSFKQFKADLKTYSNILIIKEIDEDLRRPQVVIDFPDEQYQEIYDIIRQFDIVDIIDPILPLDKKIIEKELKVQKAKDTQSNVDEVKDRQKKMAKFLK